MINAHALETSLNWAAITTIMMGLVAFILVKISNANTYKSKHRKKVLTKK